MSKELILVEDDAVTVLLLRRYLRHAHQLANINHFEYGADAIEYFNAHSDKDIIVILDLNLPDISGIDILKAIRSHPSAHQTPVIVLTTSNLDTDKQTCMALGICKFLEKPIDFAVLAETLMELNIFIDS